MIKNTLRLHRNVAPALATALLACTAVQAGPVGPIDDFSTPGLSDYTLTKILDQGSVDNISFDDSTGRLSATSIGADGAEQVLFLHNGGFSLDIGEELQVDADLQSSVGNDLGLAVGATPTAGVREDYLFISFRSPTQLNSRGFIGTGEIGQVQEFGVNADTLFITRAQESVFELGWYDAGVRNVLRTEDVGASLSIADNVGFYADLRVDGDLYDGLDNLRIAAAPIAGDVNGDGFVDGVDFGVIRDNLFNTGVPRTSGDLTNDGIVDFADYRQWKDNAGEFANLFSLSSVPEPVGAALAALAIAGTLGARRRG